MTRATLAEIYRLTQTPLMRAVGHREPQLPELERLDVSIRPMRADVWPSCPDCERDVNDCRCGDEK